ncbi:neuropeptide-like 1 isoform X2 [Microplitis demolitor]|uniref:neuropeptide-like 1 isoform X2 n=1 Tax=Microplitis demolitor TaxID=69319 RepID=UPI00235B5B3B|nr:neuropeptide-like 1 isoform X2 [Microplitis demolitor]
MPSSRHFTSLLLILFAIIVDQLQIPLVTCQEEEDMQCLPRKTFLAFLRLPEVSSNLAAYSRSARIIQDARNDFMHLKALSSEDTSDDTKICFPAEVYYEIFSDPTMRAHLSVIERAQRMVENPEHDAVNFETEKRSIATLAKNDDLPASIQDRYQGEDDDEKRSQSSMSPDEILKMYVGHTPEELGKSAEDIINEYTLPNGEIDVESLSRDFHSTKRNVAALARDYALPSGRRNSASADSQQSSLHGDKRNIAMLARDRLLPKGYKRNIGSLGRVYIVPSYQGKRNIAALARDSMLPMGKRYLGALVKSGGYPYIYNKRNIASLARNGVYNYVKRNIGTLARDWNLPQSRHSRSLNEKELGAARIDLDNLQRIDSTKHNDDLHAHNHDFDLNKFSKGFKLNKNKNSNKSILESELVDAKNKSRSKRQIDYSEEYPLPVMQNANVLDYDDFMEALIADYPIAEKRFMGAGTATSERHENGDVNDDGTDDDKAIKQTLMGYQDVYQPSKRHIGALARLGWLPSFRAARFSRSPRYLVGRSDQ